MLSQTQNSVKTGPSDEAKTCRSSSLTSPKFASISIGPVDAIAAVCDGIGDGLAGSVIEAGEVPAGLGRDLTHGAGVTVLAGATEGGASEHGALSVVPAGVGVAGPPGVIGGEPGVNRGLNSGEYQ